MLCRDKEDPFVCTFKHLFLFLLDIKKDCVYFPLLCLLYQQNKWYSCLSVYLYGCLYK